MTYLITGAAGFVARHLINQIYSLALDTAVYAIDVNERPAWMQQYAKLNYLSMNLLDEKGIKDLICRIAPDRIIHLASFSSVAYSWDHPSESFLNNSLIFTNLIEALRDVPFRFSLLSIGSSEEYGNVSEEDIPLSENHRLSATSPYAAARISQEMLSQVFVQGYKMDIRMTRSFNHMGPFQRETFIAPSLVKQFAAAQKSGKDHVELMVGDIDVIRDFTDVRDVVRAYLAILDYGTAGGIYNVCSGNGIRIRDLIDRIAGIMGMTYSINIDSTRIRPAENRIVIGNNRRICEECHWCPQIDMDETLRDIIASWMSNQKSF